MTDDDTPTYYVNGEEVEIHGVSINRQTTSDGVPYPDFSRLTVRFPDNIQTREVPVNTVKGEGGITTLMDDLSERGIIPQFVANGKRVPPEHPDRDDE